MKIAALVLSVGFAALAHGALADQPASPAAAPPSNDMRAACKADVEKLCPGIQPGGGRIRDCMKEHAADLSDACKQAIATRKADRP